MENNGRKIMTGVLVGLASAASIMTIANMQKGEITNTGIIVGGISGPMIVLGIKNLLKD